MISLRTIKNTLLKYLNDNEIVVYKYYNEVDDLEYVEVFKCHHVDSEMRKFKSHYLHEWERYVNMNKYKLGIKSGVWVKIYTGYDFENMTLVSDEFYTK